MVNIIKKVIIKRILYPEKGVNSCNFFLLIIAFFESDEKDAIFIFAWVAKHTSVEGDFNYYNNLFG